MVDLSPLELAFSINERGEIAGTSFVDGVHAVVWRNRTVTDLGTLPGDNYTFALGINDHSEVVGFAAPSPIAPSRAVLWNRGTLTDLGVLPGALSSLAQGINNRGQIVGTSGSHAVVWEESTR